MSPPKAPSSSPGPPPPPANDADVFIQVPDPIEVPAERSEQADTISVDFPDEDVRVIIRNVADLFGPQRRYPTGADGSGEPQAT